MPFLTDMYHEQNRARTGSTETTTTENTAKAAEFDPDRLRALLRERILGQDEAIETVVRAIVLAKAGAVDPDRPLANLLLVGPTGVGKTELVRTVAAQLRSGPDDLCRVDMNALAQEHYAASFSGAPPGYAGSKEAYSVFDRDTVQGDPYRPGIVLFDEVEKAHPTVLRALLQVLDSGILKLASGQERISFRNTLVFLTSNLGSAEIARIQGIPWRRGVDRLLRRGRRPVIDAALREFFDPEFVNRIDDTVHFAELGKDTARGIVSLEVALLRKRLLRKQVHLEVSEDVLAFLAERGFDPVYGARALRRTMRTQLTAAIAEEIVRHGPDGGAALHLTASAPDGAVRVSGQRTE
ncbi:AAA family ATPase [Sciscionella marina]|uniref:AAA family ATPase n=1 Tax=Sciscionella marina TaxID=508770 RepID=UPI00037936E3|nr:AAA family ATPase [Sciscionella marina]